MANTSDTKTPLLVKKSEAKKGSLWHDLANRRIIKQHGGYDIPEGDLHAVQKVETPVLSEQATPQETNEKLTEIEKEIQNLKQKESQQFTPSTPPKDFEEFLDEREPQKQADQNDEF